MIGTGATRRAESSFGSRLTSDEWWRVEITPLYPTPSPNKAVNRGGQPGVVNTPLHRETPKDVMESLSPMGRPSTVKDIADAVTYLTDAATVTGDILYVDGGAHFGRW